jgi:O-antigen/teichoic acid export membrane protein
LQRYDIGSKITIGVNVARSSGYIVLAVAGFGLIHLLLWDLIFGLGTLAVRVLVVRRLLPGLRLMPSFSFRGLREIIGYSIFSFLTWAVHTMHRESGKLLLGRLLGAAPVAYLGTPDSIAQRIHMVIASGSEALIPRFSAGRDRRAAERLFWGSTWSALALSLILLIPFFVLVPDFLRLWISPEFARASGTAGQALALYLVAQGAFAPVAAYFRGTGKPWFVSLVIFGALVITVLSSLQLIPVYGVEGAAYAYLAGSAAPFLGVIVGGIYAFGRSSSGALLRAVGLPVVTGSLTCVLGVALRSRFGELSWVGLGAHGAAVLALGVVLVIGSDLFLGGQNSSAKQLLTRIASSRRVAGLLKRIPMKTFSAKPVAEV